MLRVSNIRRSGAGFGLNGGFRCESVNGTITSPCASAGRIQSKSAAAPITAAARPVLIASRRFMVISVPLRLESLYVPSHSVNGVAVRLDARHLVLNRPRTIDVKRRRRIVNVEHLCRLLSVIAQHRHRKLPLGHVLIEPRGIVIKADENELYTFLALILFVGLLDER